MFIKAGFASAVVLVVGTTAAWATGLFSLHGSGGTGGTPQAIASVSLSPSPASVAANSPDGTIVGAITVTMSPSSPPSSATVTVDDVTHFRVSGSNVVTNGILPSSPPAYSIHLTATQAGTSNGSLTSSAITVNITSAPQVVQSISITNATFTAQAGNANTTIGTLSATTLPASPTFSGCFTENSSVLVITGCNTLKIGSSDITSSGGFNVDFTATPTDGSISAKTQTITITGLAPAGGPLTTYTVRNNSSSPSPAGAVYMAGQGFRRGDLPPGSYPVFRDSVTHAPLVQQLSEIATRRENGDDNSIRHVQFGVQLPSIPANGTYTMEIVKQTGTYSATGKQTLTALCAAHQLKLDFSDVRNQDDSVRDSGHMVFDICAASANTGRDAPRHTAAGPVFDTYIVRGAPVYPETGHKDPLIYVEAVVDLTTSVSDQTSLGQVRHVEHITNPWMNVRASSVGNSGAPGPAGFVNDPQALSYRPKLLDGSTTLIDYSFFDNTVNSSSNPVNLNPSQANACPSFGSIPSSPTAGGNITLPNSVGLNALQAGVALRFSTDGTPPSGLINNKLYWTDGVGIVYSGSNPNNTQLIHLAVVPNSCHASSLPNGGEVNVTSQGSGNHTFSFRVWHPKFLGWYALTPDGLDNWTNGTARTTSPFLPAFTASERTYWEQSGTIPAFKRINETDSYLPNHGFQEYESYQPMMTGLMGGVSAGSEKAPLGLFNDYFVQAFILETPAAWQNARIASLGRGTWTYGTIYDEVTGYPPVTNNGHLNSDHTASGVPYNDGVLTIPLRPNTADIFDEVTMDGITPPLEGTPVAGYIEWGGGVLGAGRQFGSDHLPSYANGMYQIFGARYQLNTMYEMAGDETLTISIGNDNAVGWEHQAHTVNGIKYYGIADYCCQIRGSAWINRERINCAAYGDDSNWQRSMCQDELLSTRYYDEAIDAWVDTGGGNYTNGYVGPSYEPYRSSFKDGYVGTTAAYGWGLMRDSLSQRRITKYIRIYKGRCAANGGGIAGAYGDGYYCASFNWVENLRDNSKSVGTQHPDILTQGLGQYFVNDATEQGEVVSLNTVQSDGTVVYSENPQFLFMTNGDTVKSIRQGPIPGNADIFAAPDQLQGGIWYTISNVTTLPNGSAVTFKIINPATGTPFTAYTLNGSSINGTGYAFYVKSRPAISAPSTSFHTLTYIQYIEGMLTAFKNVGFGGGDVDAMLNKITARGFTVANWPKLAYDRTIVVP